MPTKKVLLKVPLDIWSYARKIQQLEAEKGNNVTLHECYINLIRQGMFKK